MKILCPIDFSTNAMKALEASIYYCKLLEADLHIINIATSFSNVDKNKEKLTQLLAGISAVSEGFIRPITKVSFGKPSHEIIKHSDTINADMIIMGTKGYNNLKTLLFGSITSAVAQKSNVPVMAIPSELVNEFNTSMTLSVDQRAIDNEEAFRVPMLIAKANGVKIDILHIQEKENEFPFDPFLIPYLQDTCGEIHLINKNDIIQDVKNFVEEHKTGLLIMMRREKSIFNKLMNVSNIKEEIAVTNTPILVIPA